jgi:hypothetical protein
MKFTLLSLMFVLTSISFVSAIPKDFEVSNIYWASEGTIEQKPFLLGLVELSWESGKGKTNSVIVYFDYDGEKFYSSSLGLIKDAEQLNFGIAEAQFYPLKNYASESIIDKTPKYSLVIQISQNGKIDFEKVRISKLNMDLTFPDSFRTEHSDVDNLFPGAADLIPCSKSISHDRSSTEKCGDDDDYTEETIGEYERCITENEKIKGVTFDCSILCLKNFYKESFGENKNFGKCSVYSDIDFVRVSSDSLDFNELIRQNSELEMFNPWRGGP